MRVQCWLGIGLIPDNAEAELLPLPLQQDVHGYVFVPLRYGETETAVWWGRLRALDDMAVMRLDRAEALEASARGVEAVPQ